MHPRASEGFRIGHWHAVSGQPKRDHDPRTFYGRDYHDGYAAGLNEQRWTLLRNLQTKQNGGR